MARRRAKSARKKAAGIQKVKVPALSGEAKQALLAIADETAELAEHIENIGPLQSTLDKIDKLRKRIVKDSARHGWSYVRREGRNPIATELHDLLLTIFRHILPYYRSIQSKPNPLENAKRLRYAAERLRLLAGIPKTKADVPMKLREFFREFCEPLKPNILESRVLALQGRNQKKKLKPQLQRVRHERGKSDLFSPSFLIKNWPTYIEQLPQLPPLKQF